MRPRLLVAVLLILALGTLGSASAASASTAPSSEATAGGVGIGLVDIPLAAQDDPRARRYIIDNLPPGTSISRRVQVTNSTAEVQDVQLYAGSARITDGVFSGDAQGSTNELSDWTFIEPSAVRVEPGGEEVVTVMIEVPSDASEGEQYAAVWAEVTRDLGDETITTASRAGVRMYVSVAPGNGPAADFVLGAVTASRTPDGRAVITADVRNSGGRALDLTGELRLKEGPSGLSAGPFSSQEVTTLAPGATGELLVELGPDIPEGPWQAELIVTSGLLERTVTAAVTFSEAGQVATVVADSAPWIAIGVVVALLSMSVIVFVLLRRRRVTPGGSRA